MYFRYIKAFSYEIAIEEVWHSSFRYLKESDTERELQIGKFLIYISKTNYPIRGIFIE